MTYEGAINFLQDYYYNDAPSPDDEFMFTEALGYLIEETGNPEFMFQLGWIYCGKKQFDLELKYMEMAAEYGYLPALEELGYMWYFGQHGEIDYDKAFYYFSKGAGNDKTHGSLWCRFKLADMYRFGCSVEKDEDKYREMIEEAYEAVKNPTIFSAPFPEIALRLAGIRAVQGQKEEAVNLLREAKRFMAGRLTEDPFWGNIEVMGRIIRYLYELEPFNGEKADFYDLFYLTEKPGKYFVKYKGRKMPIEVTAEDGVKALKFDGKWYRSFEELCQNAVFNRAKITYIYDEFYDVEEAG